MPSEPRDAKLYCRISRCRSLLAILPGYRVVRQLEPGEEVEPPSGAFMCHGRDCGARWEVAPIEATRAEPERRKTA